MRFFLKTFLILSLFAIDNLAAARQPIVIIDPAGHAKDLGRLLVEGYERAETLKFARALKKELAKLYNVKPIVSRSPGEEILPLQIPSFSNRIKSEFVLRIHMYREESEKPKLFLYNLLFHPMIDVAKRTSDQLSFTPLHRAHFASVEKTRFCGRKMFDYLNQDSLKKYFDCYNLQGIPLRSLVGVTSPAILLELGICRENKWKSLVRPIAQSLSFLLGR